MMNRALLLGVFIAVVGLPVPVTAQDQLKDSAANLLKFSDRAHRKQWEQGKQELVGLLKNGEARDFYRQELERAGYLITSVNYDKADYMEYEIVKGDQTYEVEINIDKNTQRASKVDISANLWLAETTDQVLKGKKKQVSKKESYKKDNERYSDRDRKGQWEQDREELAKALKSGQERDFYRRALGKMGYLITSVNQDKPDYMEYEVVKGDQTYEVQIDLDQNNHKATKVDISSNMWKAEATEKVLASNKKAQASKLPRSRGGSANIITINEGR